VAFKLAQGWFVDPKGDDCGDNVESDWRAIDLRLADLVPGGSFEVILRTSTQNYELYANDEGYVKRNSKDCESNMIACGVPAKGAPSCLYLQTGKANYCIYDGTADWQWQLDPVFSADGQVEVKGTGALDADARLFMGRRRLAFP
jgi:hypothetical protein